MAEIRPRVAFVFPGQGSQNLGMGHGLYKQSSAAQEVWRAADASGNELLTSRVFDGVAESLRSTDVQQPAIVATSIAALAAFNEELGFEHGFVGSGYPINVAVFAGHSVGLVSALVGAGCTPIDEAVALVRDRGRYMAAAARDKPGRMAAVLGLDVVAVEDLVASIRRRIPGSYLSIANVNSPQQVVVAGDLLAIDQVVNEGRESGARRVIPLDVSGAFHSIAMFPARESMRKRLVAVGIDAPIAPVLSNVDATELTTPSEIRAELADHIVAPVRWLDGAKKIETMGVKHVVEFGHGSVLTGMLRRTVKEVELHNVSDVESARSVAGILT